MLNPRACPIIVNGTEYGVTWQDFGQFKRLNVFKDDRRIGYRNLPILVDEGHRTIRYLIRKMVGNNYRPSPLQSRIK